MLPQIVTVICIIFILFLFWNDRKRGEPFPRSLWIPFLWMFFSSGRSLSQWVHLGPETELVASFQEGDTLNLVFFLFLIIAGVVALSAKKEIDWAGVLNGNKLIWLYLFYCLLSLTWSPYPFISFKRWVKEAGNLVMVMVILGQDRPGEAVAALLRRLSFLCLPLSVLFIKYYPALGRAYSEQGEQMFTGIGFQKNELGALCLISGIYYAWHFILRGGAGLSPSDENIPGGEGAGPPRGSNGREMLHVLLAMMLLWLLHLSHSATSLVCAIVAVALFLVVRATPSKPTRIITMAAVASLSYFVLEATTGVNAFILHMLGRRSDLTDRTFIWAATAKEAGNHWVGVGYQSFWLGERLNALWENTGANIIQAHNGYLEQYLNLGYIGVAFIIALMLLGLCRVRKLLVSDNSVGALMLSFLVVVALYNYTEASFFAVNNLWLLFILAIVSLHKLPQELSS